MQPTIFKATIISILFFALKILPIHSQPHLIPKPVHYEAGQDAFTLNKKTKIVWQHPSSTDKSFLTDYLREVTHFPLKESRSTGSNNIIITNKTTRTDLGEEGYELTVDLRNITIAAPNSAGVFYGIQTLLQLMPAEVYAESLPANKSYPVAAAYIYDYPRFGWRGMMLDVSRQFFDVAFVKRYIDHLAAHKINIFHWHLTDDEGWRIEIKKYPLLTEKGAWRGKNEVLPPAHGSGDERYGGFYTQEEIKDVVAYAQQRNVSILPEIDLPGHSRAVTATYPYTLCLSSDTTSSVQGVKQNVWCAGREENYSMIEDILSEVASLFPFEYIHIGGDEVNKNAWQHCERCQELLVEREMSDIDEIQGYFVRRAEAIVNKLGKKMIGWNEIMDGGKLQDNSAVMAWKNKSFGYTALQKGYNAIFVPAAYLYFDMTQSPEEQGHSWAGIVSTEMAYSFDPLKDNKLSTNEIQKIKGVQAALWGEFLDQPAGIVDYQTYPRLCALAELAWTPQREREWEDFHKRLEEGHYPRLYNMGITFRLPPAEATFHSGEITVQNPGSGLVTRYTSNGTEPEANSTLYKKPIETNDFEDYRFKTFYKNLGSITTPAYPTPVSSWTPENVTSKYSTLQIEITPKVLSSGPLKVLFRLKGGEHALLVRKVTLLENGKEIGIDKHDGLMAAAKTKDNSYQFTIDSYKSNATYQLKIELRGRWGTDSFGDILIY